MKNVIHLGTRVMYNYNCWKIIGAGGTKTVTLKGTLSLGTTDLHYY